MVFPLVGFDVVEKEQIFDWRRPEFTRLALVAALRCFLLLNFLQPNMLMRFKDSDCV